jgi:hypothetical protein
MIKRMPSWAQPFRKIAIRMGGRPRDLKRSLRDVRSTVPDRTNRLIGSVSFAGFAGGSMRYQVSSNELRFEVYGSSDGIWNHGDEVCVDFATDAASIFESKPE